MALEEFVSYVSHIIPLGFIMPYRSYISAFISDLSSSSKDQLQVLNYSKLLLSFKKTVV